MTLPGVLSEEGDGFLTQEVSPGGSGDREGHKGQDPDQILESEEVHDECFFRRFPEEGCVEG